MSAENAAQAEKVFPPYFETAVAIRRKAIKVYRFMKELLATVKENKRIAEGIWAITLTLPESVGEIKGGQFANLSVGDSAYPLKRPLGICSAEGNDVTLCYQLKGEGTHLISQKEAGEKLSVLLPLGNGFDLGNAKNVAVIGGGVGIFPLAAVVRQHAGAVNFRSYIGFRGKQYACLEDVFSNGGSLTVATDDGSMGMKGNAVGAFLSDYKEGAADLIISCGPPVMLRALKEALKERGIKTKCLVSLEERMGCGIGACLVCVCKKSDGHNARVCKDGPVFDINEVEL